MNKCILVSIFFTVLCGCVSKTNIPIAENAIPGRSIHSVIISKREIPSFRALTPGKAFIGGLVGALTAISAGNEIVKSNSIEDPAPYIGSEFFRSLATKYELEEIKKNVPVLNNESLVEICKLYSSSDYVLDVETTAWGFTYFPTVWGKYRVIYHAKLKLIDTGKKNILAEGFCSRVPEQDKNSPSYEELMANKAEWIKAELKVAADYCIDNFLREILKSERATAEVVKYGKISEVAKHEKISDQATAEVVKQEKISESDNGRVTFIDEETGDEWLILKDTGQLDLNGAIKLCKSLSDDLGKTFKLPSLKKFKNLKRRYKGTDVVKIFESRIYITSNKTSVPMKFWSYSFYSGPDQSYAGYVVCIDEEKEWYK